MRLPVTSHSLRSKQASSSELVNCYLEKLPADAKAPYLIRRTPGIDHFSSLGPIGPFGSSGGSPIRAMQYFDPTQQVVYVVGDESFSNIVAIDSQSVAAGPQGTASALNSTARADIEVNADAMVVVIEPYAYSLTHSGGVITSAQISDTDFTSRGAGDVEFLDNFLLFREPNSGRFFGADLGSTTSFDALNFATAEGSPDRLVGMKSDKAQILLAGKSSMEFWDTTGGTGFPFRRTINGVINKGCINGKTLVLVDDRIIWVADDYTVRMLDGLTPVKISNSAIDQQLQADLSVRSSAVAFWHHFEGHVYYVLRTSKKCHVYDTTTGLWHSRKSHGYDTWLYSCSTQAWGHTLLGADLPIHRNYVSPYFEYPLAYMSSDIYTEMTHPLTMSWTYQPVYGDGSRIFHDRLEIIVETGVGTDSTEPVVMLEMSDDGEKTWTSMPNRSIGAIGEKYQRVVWHNVGSSYQRIYRASVSDAVPVTVVDTILHAKGGRV